MKKSLKLIIIFSTLVFASCAGNQKQIIQYKDLINKRDYKTALELIKNDGIYKDQESRLLKHLELGTLHLYSGNYFQSLKNLDEAKEISDKLFTVSISKKLAGTLMNSSADNYYGEKYERSLIRYYLIMAHYNLYEKGSYEAFKEDIKDQKGKVTSTKDNVEVTLDDGKKRFHLTAAKAVLLEWNSILDDLKKTSAGEVTYKDDLLAKFVGAVIHEKADTSADRQIALNLYKESKNTILKYYNSYPSFNTKHSDFNKDYKKLPELNPELLVSTYITSTPMALDVNTYSDEQIKNFGKKEKERDNVYLVWHEGLIAGKEIKKYQFPIGLAAATISIGTTADFITFSRYALVIVGQNIPKVEFEMPTIPYRANNEDYKLIVKKAGVVVTEKSGVLVDPLSEMAYYTLNNRARSDLTAIGTRVAAKHLTALVTAYLTYRQIQANMGEGIALLAGTAAYNLASKGIAESEKADLRSWMTLPNQVRMNSFKLEAGDYDLYAFNSTSKEEKLVGKFKVKSDEKVSLKTFF